MIFCCVAIAITKIITKRTANKRKALQAIISQAIEEALFPESRDEIDCPTDHFSVPQKNYGLRNFVEVLENYDQRFADDRWIVLKKSICDRYLMKEAKEAVISRSWIKRQLAARAYRLYPEKISEGDLGILIRDPKNLVRIVAANIIVKTPYMALFYEMIEIMSAETSLSQFFYRDALLASDHEKFVWMEDLLRKEENPKIIAILLDVLSTRYSKDLFPLIKPFAVSEDRACRVLAIKAIGSISSDDSVKILMERLSDSDWEVRAASIEGLKEQHERKAIPEFAELLNDPVWWVRLQAAQALEAFGAEGDEILKSQNFEERPHAHEIAAYVLSLQPTTA